MENRNLTSRLDRPGRIDLFENDLGIRVMKWPENWQPHTPPAISYINTDMSLDQIAEFLEAKGWTIRRWHQGARAWKGDICPIRTRGQILRKREQLTRHPRPGLQLCTIDLAFDC